MKWKVQRYNSQTWYNKFAWFPTCVDTTLYYREWIWLERYVQKGRGDQKIRRTLAEHVKLELTKDG